MTMHGEFENKCLCTMQLDWRSTVGYVRTNLVLGYVCACVSVCARVCACV